VRTSGTIARHLSPSAYWRVRSRELKRQFDELWTRAEVVQLLKERVCELSPTAMSGTEEWDSLITQSRRAVSKVRAQRTRVKGLCLTDRDTLRSSTDRTQACPQEHRDEMAKVWAYLEWLEAMGY
jgi:hypothetical protein